MGKNIFVPAIGAFGNLGDIVLRRALLQHLSGNHPLHVFVGGAPESYVLALGLDGRDNVYRSFVHWYLKLLTNSVFRPVAYVFKPGEIQVTLKGLKEHLVVIPALVVLRLRGLPVIRVGVGSRNWQALASRLIRPSLKLSSMIVWREATSRDLFRTGTVAPDLAFVEGSNPNEWPDADDRGIVTVSFRSDRPYPSRDSLHGLRTWVRQRQLTIVVVSQVEEDNERTVKLADDLGGEARCLDVSDFVGEERELRALYSRSVLTVSDRLHVLIMAATEGALPAPWVTARNGKIQRHFGAANIGVQEIDATALSSEQASGGLEEIYNRADQIRAAIVAARAETHQVLQKVGEELA